MNTITALPVWLQVVFWWFVAAAAVSGLWIAFVARRRHLERKWDRQADQKAKAATRARLEAAHEKARAEVTQRTTEHVASEDHTHAFTLARFRAQLDRDPIVFAFIDVWSRDGAR